MITIIKINTKIVSELHHIPQQRINTLISYILFLNYFKKVSIHSCIVKLNWNKEDLIIFH
jgi:hypothetical protein